MRKTHTQFEQVPVEVAERILKQQNLPAVRDADRKLVVRKSRRTSIQPNAPVKKPGVTTS